MKYLNQITSISLVLIVMGLLFLIGPAHGVTEVSAASYGYSAPTYYGGGGGGGGSSANDHPTLTTPSNTRTLENVPATGEQAQANAPGVTGAATANGATGNIIISVILIAVLLIAGFFLWKKYK